MLAAEVHSVKALRRMARRFFRGGEEAARRVFVPLPENNYFVIYNQRK
ncbi:MAG TPA: hypothetical protein PKW95_15240 [bacterium]|nr:hypothetical protein [bacterium]